MNERNDDRRNLELLMRLADDFGTLQLGNFNKFMDTPMDWRCPSCFRSKEEFARLDKNGRLLCAIQPHHDHFGDEFRRSGDDMQMWEALRASCTSFPPTLICEDCNNADADAKAIAKAATHFSFAPQEICSFIFVRNNQPHDMNKPLVWEVYEIAMDYRKIVRARADTIRRAAKGEPGQFQLAGVACDDILRRLKAANPALGAENDGDKAN